MMKNKFNFGFTLIEVLVASSIVIAASTIVVGIITTTFRTSNKTISIEQIRENGNFAVSQITKEIQFADAFNGVSDNGSEFDTTCISGTSYRYVQVRTGVDIKTISCLDDSGTTEGIYLKKNDQAARSLISSENVVIEGGTCSITCSLGEGSVSPVIGISFDLSLSDSFKANLPEGASATNFSTSIKMRNF